MADILISGIQFPKFSPHVIEIYPNGTAIAQGKGIYGKAVPVPPHGRLIDADEIREKFFCGEDVKHDEIHTTLDAVLYFIDGADTVIKASE